MPTYEYRCPEHGVFELNQPIQSHKWGVCPKRHCDSIKMCKQVLTAPPGLDIESMADVGMPGAMEISGDRLERRHIQAGQTYTHPEKARKYKK